MFPMLVIQLTYAIAEDREVSSTQYSKFCYLVIAALAGEGDDSHL